MIAESNHCRIVAGSINGQRCVDEHTYASLAVLCERLERLKKLDDAFCDVSFSPDVNALVNQKKSVPVM
jgi:hypothetical protein